MPMEHEHVVETLAVHTERLQVLREDVDCIEEQMETMKDQLHQHRTTLQLQGLKIAIIVAIATVVGSAFATTIIDALKVKP